MLRLFGKKYNTLCAAVYSADNAILKNILHMVFAVHLFTFKYKYLCMLAVYSVFQQGSTSQVNSRFVGEWGQGCKRVWDRRDANTGTDSEMKRVMQDKKLYCLNCVKKIQNITQPYMTCI